MFCISLHYVVLFHFSYLVTDVSFHAFLHEAVSFSKQIWRPTDEALQTILVFLAANVCVLKVNAN